MEFLDGRIFEDPAIPDVTPEERTKMYVLLPSDLPHNRTNTRLGGTQQSRLSPSFTA
jgi:hypothetical protein